MANLFTVNQIAAFSVLKQVESVKDFSLSAIIHSIISGNTAHIYKAITELNHPKFKSERSKIIKALKLSDEQISSSEVFKWNDQQKTFLNNIRFEFEALMKAGYSKADIIPLIEHLFWEGKEKTSVDEVKAKVKLAVADYKNFLKLEAAKKKEEEELKAATKAAKAAAKKEGSTEPVVPKKASKPKSSNVVDVTQDAEIVAEIEDNVVSGAGTATSNISLSTALCTWGVDNQIEPEMDSDLVAMLWANQGKKLLPSMNMLSKNEQAELSRLLDKMMGIQNQQAA